MNILDSNQIEDLIVIDGMFGFDNVMSQIDGDNNLSLYLEVVDEPEITSTEFDYSSGIVTINFSEPMYTDESFSGYNQYIDVQIQIDTTSSLLTNIALTSLSNDGMSVSFNIDEFSGMPTINPRSTINLETINGLIDSSGSLIQNATAQIIVVGFTPEIIPTYNQDD